MRKHSCLAIFWMLTTLVGCSEDVAFAPPVAFTGNGNVGAAGARGNDPRGVAGAGNPAGRGQDGVLARGGNGAGGLPGGAIPPTAGVGAAGTAEPSGAGRGAGGNSIG